MFRRSLVLWGALLVVGVCAAGLVAPAPRVIAAQQPTGSIPTVTGTPRGPMVTVYLDLGQIEVYAGPSTYSYLPNGLLLAGQQVPALGRSSDGNWIQIYYPGVTGSRAWVYAPYVSISRGAELPVVEAPPTPTPGSTPTIDPTLAAALITPEAPRRLPTFTMPAPLAAPAFDDPEQAVNRMPVGLLILGLGFLGGLGVLISFLQGR